MIKKSKINPFVDENNRLKKALSEEERSRLKVSNELSELKIKFKEFTKPKACPVCIFRDRKTFTTIDCQTDSGYVETMDKFKKQINSGAIELSEVNEKYKALQKLHQSFCDNLKLMENEKCKENTGNNANNVSRNDAEFISLKKQYNELFEVYNQLKVAFIALKAKNDEEKSVICQSIQTDPIESDAVGFFYIFYFFLKKIN